MTVKSPKDWYRLFFFGMCMGAADIVPGVSGGTMALICGIYEKLIASIKSLGTANALSIFRLDFNRFNRFVAWDFLFAILLGIGFSLVIFSQAIHYMLGDPTWRTYLYMLFYGMVVASIITCVMRIPKWEKRMWWGLAAGIAATLIFTGFRSEPLLIHQQFQVKIPSNFRYSGDLHLLNYDKDTDLLNNLDEETLAAMWEKGYLDSRSEVYELGSDRVSYVEDIVIRRNVRWFNPWLFLCGAIAVSAMLLPGVSGSFLLMILGTYPVVIGALAELVQGWTQYEWNMDAVIVLGNIGLGICLGAIVFSKVIDWFLQKDHDLTMAVLIGFMAGSLRVIWPFWEYAWRLDPLKLSNGPELVPVATITPSVWDPVYWKSIPFLFVGFGMVYFLHRISENTKKS